MRRIHREGSQHRENAFPEQGAHPVLLRSGQFVPREDLDALGPQLGPDLLLEQAGLLGDELGGAFQDRGVQLPRPGTGDGGHGHPGLDAAFQSCDSHHEELVEVVGEDRQELHALQQRDALHIAGQVQHPVVEVQPGQFPVQVAVLGKFPVLASGHGVPPGR